MYAAFGGAVRYFVGKAVIVQIPVKNTHSLPSGLSLYFHSYVPSREWWHRLQYWALHMILQQRKCEIKSAIKAAL